MLYHFLFISQPNYYPTWLDSLIEKQVAFEENYFLNKVISEDKQSAINNYKAARTLEIFDLLTVAFFCGTILIVLIKNQIRYKTKRTL